MKRQHHYIKILPVYYNAIDSGEKSFEVRYNDSISNMLEEIDKEANYE